MYAALRAPPRSAIRLLSSLAAAMPGHRLALIIYGIDAQQTQRPDTVTKIDVDTDTVTAIIPVSVI